ncbi:MAG: 50S ribosome-binding GTPase, partial [Clostridia bacterium]|nr:50S ribosome-binding GTPase [Clostridia bacterium]
ACHGGEVITSLNLSSVFAAGAKPAKAGEFSRRAFVNGKLSLTAAEGIADLLDAKTEEAALLSAKAVGGALSETIMKISDRLLAAASSLWAYLDYPEEDLQSLSDGEMLAELSQIKGECEKLLRSFRTGRAVLSGVPAAIVGKPNVGKSTFFNAFLGEERAIVTAIPGTTRDVIEYPVKAGRILLNLADTAGLRDETADRVEEIGVERALSTVREAEVIFALFDLSRPLEEDDEKVIAALREKKDSSLIIPVFTKSDLNCVLDTDGLSEFGDALTFTNQCEMDFDEIVSRVERFYITDESDFKGGKILANARQKADLTRAIAQIDEISSQIISGAKDLASLTIEACLSTLLSIDGKEAGEKILDQVFSRFCVGK